LKCVDCSQPAEEGKRRCRKHLDLANEKEKERMAKNEENGLCKKCGEVRVDWRYKNCEDCRAVMRKYNKHNDKVKDLVRERRANGLCTRCGNERGDGKGKSYCQKCYEWNRNRMRMYR
jgi:hypothetical protein